MLKLPKTIFLTCFLLFFLSCSRSQTSSSVTSQSYRSTPKRNYSKNVSLQDPAINRFIVPPEIAIMRTRITATASSFAAVAKLIEVNSEKVITSISSTEGCSANILDYQHPVEYISGKAIVADAKKYSSHLELEILISFAEMEQVRERIKRVNDCLQVIPKLAIENSQEDKNASIYLALSDVMPTIQNAGKYRKKLLEGKFTGLKEVANLSDPATQFNASDTRCTSKGIVKVVDRNLSGIELDIDFDCHRLINNKVVLKETEAN